MVFSKSSPGGISPFMKSSSYANKSIIVLWVYDCVLQPDMITNLRFGKRWGERESHLHKWVERVNQRMGFLKLPFTHFLILILRFLIQPNLKMKIVSKLGNTERHWKDLQKGFEILELHVIIKTIKKRSWV
jgi:hypothetical protein